MKAGDRIRVSHYYGNEDFTVEEFRFCLGFFESDEHRKAGQFTPLCELYEKGPESVEGYISNFGTYYTNPVQAWMDIPKPTIRRIKDGYTCKDFDEIIEREWKMQ